MNQVFRVWRVEPSSLIMPSGIAIDSDLRSRCGFLDLKDKAVAIEALFAKSGVSLRSDSGLGRMIQNAKDLWGQWFVGQGEIRYELLFAAMHLDRIAEAVLPLAHEDEDTRTRYLNALLSGTVGFFERKQSRAKNLFWELELWSRLRRKNQRIFLKEPPDITVEFDDARIGIACKKVYSESGVEKTLSRAVNQIEGRFEFGIAAINLDDLLPPNAILREASSEAVKERLHRCNGEFLQRHDRHFRRYLASGRLVSVIVSSAVICDVPIERPQFSNAWQWTAWTIPGLPEEHQVQLQRFYEIVMG